MIPAAQDPLGPIPLLDPATLPPGTLAPFEVGTPQEAQERPSLANYGPNGEKLPRKLQLALQLLLTMYVNEGMRARRDEIKKCRLAREFWKGLQYAYWTENDGQWHLPWELKGSDDASGDEPRYAFVTNYYQAFGLSIMAVLSQDVPRVRTWPQNPEEAEDVATADEATTIIQLVERNNKVEDLLLDEAFYLWTDGKVGAYVRYVVDGDRWGYEQMDDMAERLVKFGQDAYDCPGCGHETPAEGFRGMCEQCGAPLADDNLRAAPTGPVPVVRQTLPVPNGAEVIDIVGGLELKTPEWARFQHQFPYLIWDQLAHRARLKAAFPQSAKKIASGGVAPEDTQSQYERVAQIALVSGGEMEPLGAAGDLTQNLVTYRQAWLRTWAFELLDDDELTKQLTACFPAGCKVAFAGDVYCGSWNESMDEHWRVMHAMPGDGQNRPAIGTSFISVQQRFNTLSNLVVETAERGIPATWAAPGMIDRDAFKESYAEPGAIYEGAPPPGMAMADGFFEQSALTVSEQVVEHMNMLAGPVGQFLTGAFPALFGGEMTGNDTAQGYAMARDQAMGRIGLVWRRMKSFQAEVMMLAVDCFRKNRPGDVPVMLFGKGSQPRTQWVRKANLKGNLVCYPESDAQYPTTWSQQRAVLLQLMQSPDPMIQKVLSSPENISIIKRLIGLEEFDNPFEDAESKQLREIEQLLEDGAQGAGPTIGGVDPESGMPQPAPSVQVDALLDDHQIELDTIKSWAMGEDGQQAKIQNPQGFMNVHLHAEQHAQYAQQAATGQKPVSESMNFKDLPPDGQAQMARQAGIQLNPAMLMAREIADQQKKTMAAQAKLRPPAGREPQVRPPAEPAGGA